MLKRQAKPRGVWSVGTAEGRAAARRTSGIERGSVFEERGAKNNDGGALGRTTAVTGVCESVMSRIKEKTRSERRGRGRGSACGRGALREKTTYRLAGIGDGGEPMCALGEWTGGGGVGSRAAAQEAGG